MAISKPSICLVSAVTPTELLHVNYTHRYSNFQEHVSLFPLSAN